MQPSDWIACGALLVATIALVFSAMSARSAQASANASESSAMVAQQQHAHELARDGIVQFGPWRVEAFSSGALEQPYWRFINVSGHTLHDLAVEEFGQPWNLTQNKAVEPGRYAVGTLPTGYNTCSFPAQVEVSWRDESTTAPKITTVEWVHRPERR